MRERAKFNGWVDRRANAPEEKLGEEIHDGRKTRKAVVLLSGGPSISATANWRSAEEAQAFDPWRDGMSFSLTDKRPRRLELDRAEKRPPAQQGCGENMSSSTSTLRAFRADRR